LEFFVVAKRKISHPKILDLGSGDGRFTSFLGQFGKTYALELSQYAEDIANELYPHVTYQQGNALNFDFKDVNYDVVVSQEVLEHIEEKLAYLKVCHTVLKPNCFLILTTPNKRVLDHMTDGKTWSDKPIELPIAKSGLMRLLKQHNFYTFKYDSIIMNFGNKDLCKIINCGYMVSTFN
jgi:2-polyprenyl-3-methyl-5-hydroxy-6-metoxy-1,4-benzoquinol methylase